MVLRSRGTLVPKGWPHRVGTAQSFVNGALPPSRHPCTKGCGCFGGSSSPGEQRAPRNPQVTSSRLEDPSLGPSPSLRGSQRRLSEARPLASGLQRVQRGASVPSLPDAGTLPDRSDRAGAGGLKASESVKTLQRQHGSLYLPRNPPFSSPLEEIISRSFK